MTNDITTNDIAEMERLVIEAREMIERLEAAITASRQARQAEALERQERGAVTSLEPGDKVMTKSGRVDEVVAVTPASGPFPAIVTVAIPSGQHAEFPLPRMLEARVRFLDSVR